MTNDEMLKATSGADTEAEQDNGVSESHSNDWVMCRLCSFWKRLSRLDEFGVCNNPDACRKTDPYANREFQTEEKFGCIFFSKGR